MATKAKAARGKAPPQKQPSAAQLHELARVQRRRGDAAASEATIEQARAAERREVER